MGIVFRKGVGGVRGDGDIGRTGSGRGNVRERSDHANEGHGRKEFVREGQFGNFEGGNGEWEGKEREERRRERRVRGVFAEEKREKRQKGKN